MIVHSPEEVLFYHVSFIFIRIDINSALTFESYSNECLVNEIFKIQNNLAPMILNDAFNLSDTLGKLKNHNSFERCSL